MNCIDKEINSCKAACQERPPPPVIILQETINLSIRDITQKAENKEKLVEKTSLFH